MFTRTIQLSTSTIVAAILSLSIASLAHADITKCVDADGMIAYSNTSCGDGVSLGVISIDGTPSASPSAQVKKDLTASFDRGQVRETAWAHRNLPAAKKVLDKSTIRDARQALIESDRAMAALRHQTIAANN